MFFLGDVLNKKLQMPRLEEALSGVSLRIPAGQTVAFVGETGAGKSTLVKLVARFYDPTSGAVRVDGTDLRELDLADLESVRAFTDSFPYERIDLVINSAGIMGNPHTVVGPGWESQFAVNHLGHFALVNRLWPKIGEGARVVSVSSAGHHASGIRWDDPWFERGYDRWQAYGQAKTANVLFAVHLDRLGRENGVRAFSLHPGAILTTLQRHMTTEEMVDRGWIDERGNTVNPTFKSPEQGAATQVWAATSPQLDGPGGLYLEDVEVAPLHAGPGTPGVAPHAVDPAEAERLWHLSQELTGAPGPAA
jgi:NAD(P)-dependent dehydrogenase (short-subunit alcohol dehydrogenase family)